MDGTSISNFRMQITKNEENLYGNPNIQVINALQIKLRTSSNVNKVYNLFVVLTISYLGWNEGEIKQVFLLLNQLSFKKCICYKFYSSIWYFCREFTVFAISPTTKAHRKECHVFFPSSLTRSPIQRAQMQKTLMVFSGKQHF